MDLNPISSIVKGVVGPLFGLIDNLHTSEEEKRELTLQAIAMQIEMGSKFLDYENERLKLQQQVITAEAQSASAITRMWRPITMLTFLGLVVSYWLGYTPPNVTPDMLDNVFDLIQLGLGGYVIGRSAEKVALPIINQLKKGA